MRTLLPLALLIAAALCATPSARGENITDEQLAALREGAAIDAKCLEKDVLKEIGACRYAATAVQRAPSLMLGLYFHMWFADALLSEQYRDTKPELSTVFERLADAEFPAVVAYQDSVHLNTGDVCRLLQLNCATAARYDERWRQRIKQ